MIERKKRDGDFPGGPVVRTLLPLQGSIPGQGTKRSHMPHGAAKKIKRERKTDGRGEEKRREGGGDWPREEIRLQIDFG